MLILKWIAKCYSKIYFVLAFVTPLYVIASLVLPITLGSTLTYDVATAGIRLLIASAGFWMWGKIFSQLTNLENVFVEPGSAIRRRISILMFYAFVLDLFDFFYRHIFVLVDNSPVEIPIDPRQPLLAKIFLETLSLIKYSGELGPFITPRTFGISTLFIGALLFYLSQKRTTV